MKHNVAVGTKTTVGKVYVTILNQLVSPNVTKVGFAYNFSTTIIEI